MTITIADGRGALWQWDTGRRLRVGSGVDQIHYQNRVLGGSVDVDVGADGTAIIPDELLQDCHTLTAYAYVTDDTGAYTMVQQDFAVRKALLVHPARTARAWTSPVRRSARSSRSLRWMRAGYRLLGVRRICRQAGESTMFRGVHGTMRSSQKVG